MCLAECLALTRNAMCSGTEDCFSFAAQTEELIFHLVMKNHAAWQRSAHVRVVLVGGTSARASVRLETTSADTNPLSRLICYYHPRMSSMYGRGERFETWRSPHKPSSFTGTRIYRSAYSLSITTGIDCLFFHLPMWALVSLFSSYIDV